MKPEPTRGPIETWREYGLHDTIIRDFVTKFSGASIAVTSVDITTDGLLENECSFGDTDVLWKFLTAVQVPTSTSLRVLAVKELSAESLQILSTALGIHLDFWNWVCSSQASDGFWLNNHNDGKILSFDLPCFEFYTATTVPSKKVVREGRMKHLSSRQRLFGSGLKPAKTYDIYINRRVSGYLVPTGGFHTLIYFCEDCHAVSSLEMEPGAHTGSPSTEWLLSILKESEPAALMGFTREPLGLILLVVSKLLSSWHTLTVHMQRDLEEIVRPLHYGYTGVLADPVGIDQDSSLPESLPHGLPEGSLYDIGTYLHRDVVQTLYRFTQQLGKFDGYLKYLCNGTKDHFRPKEYLRDVGNLTNNVQDLRRRFDTCKERGNMSLTLINNYIALQQARLANEQAVIAAHMARMQQRDSHSASRLSLVATVFLPLSFAASWLSVNTTTPLWVFFLVAVVSALATTIIILFLKLTEKDGESGLSRLALYLFGRAFSTPDMDAGDEEVQKIIHRSTHHIV